MAARTRKASSASTTRIGGRDGESLGAAAFTFVFDQSRRWPRRGHGYACPHPGPEPSPDGQTDVGSLGARVRLEPGESKRISFYLAWHFPNLENHWNN